MTANADPHAAPHADQLEAALRRCVAAHGDLSLAEFCREEGLPASLVYRTFGTWAALRERVGLPRRKPPTPSGPTNEEMLATLRDLEGRSPNLKLSQFTAATGLSATLVARRFGGWTRFRDAAGLPAPTTDPRQRVPTADLLLDVLHLWKRLRSFPTPDQLARHGRYALTTYHRRVGPHATLLETALRHGYGLVVDRDHGPDHPDRERLIEESARDILTKVRRSLAPTRPRRPR